jgi:hypothetical protein
MLLVIRPVGSIPWSFTSADFTPCKFHLLGYTKNQVYQLCSFKNLHSKGVAIVDESQMWRTWEEFRYLVDCCRVTDETPIEYL